MEKLKFGQFAFIIEIAKEIREAVLPFLNNERSKQSAKIAFSGDTTFELDVVAEQALEKAVRNSEYPLAYFSEDQGLVKTNLDPEWLLIVDPIDGTRPLLCGFEMGVVSVALCRYSQNVTFDNILAGVVLEIKSGDVFFAERGKGVQISSPFDKQPQPSSTKNLNKLFWSFEAVGRPTNWICKYLGKLMDVSGMEGAAFLFNNSAYSLTRIVLGQLDAYVDVGGRILKDYPESESEFADIGTGRIMGTFPYDIAASYLILQEANCVVTDACGNSLENVNLLQHGKNAVLSCIAASNLELHRKILEFLPPLN
ncbi:MAG: inositol monophosphatase family protein [bacterium]